jgi:flagellar hook-associated protein 1 FlgK
MENSKRGVQANRNALEVTSENIANVNTPNYSRRLATFTDMTATSAKFGTLTNSSVSKELSRQRNDFVDAQYLTQNPSLAKYTTDTELFTQIEDIFAEPGESGISEHLNEFWSAWGDLSNDPESESARMVVVDKAVALEKAFNRVNSELIDLKENIATNLQGNIETINNKLNALADINTEISANNSDALMDERDKLVSELSEFFEIQTYEGKHGEITISTAGQILVSNEKANELVVFTENVGNDYSLNVKIKNGTNKIDIQSGEIGSMLSVANENIPDYNTRLDNVAINLSNEVNKIHEKGYDLSDNTGLTFFKTNINGAGNFAVNPSIASNPFLVATSDQIGESANSNIAKQINELQNQTTLNGVSINEYYSGIATDIGAKVKKSEDLMESQDIIVATIKNQQDSESGVSLDEELVNLSKFQQAYQASAKVIGTVQQLVDSILSLI